VIQFTLSYAADPEKIELRTGSVDTNLAEKPPLIIRRDQLQMTLLCLLHATQAGTQPLR
jgi:hypothetical protein